MRVQEAAQILGSEVFLALIEYYRDNPRTSQASAVAALKLTQQATSLKMATLVRSGVAVAEEDPQDRRNRLYSIDMARVQELLSVLAGFLLLAESAPGDVDDPTSSGRDQTDRG